MSKERGGRKCDIDERRVDKLPTEYKKMVKEALKYWIDSPENRKKLDMAEELLKQSGQKEGRGD